MVIHTHDAFAANGAMMRSVRLECLTFLAISELSVTFLAFCDWHVTNDTLLLLCDLCATVFHQKFDGFIVVCLNHKVTFPPKLQFTNKLNIKKYILSNQH
jgi:hypothetical protein